MPDFFKKPGIYFGGLPGKSRRLYISVLNQRIKVRVRAVDMELRMMVLPFYSCCEQSRMLPRIKKAIYC
jgi:hypothetical protein